ncbi:dynamin-like GTPase SEY1 [Pneumocystis jirovecii RU7]|uniref:GB1/RHD3-type G domain-containing protein n=2 Tax=Pneumocystis jirovecii TaxID=42068 RepID=A0A0W4ZRG9_PNEJ7|nr:dynamin-like GTPase SEY1 [Pneumocystis jirovecii RU7]KTW30962.1 hypothetical protein T551_01514 [Pneumocystis jirovecii RU7]
MDNSSSKKQESTQETVDLIKFIEDSGLQNQGTNYNVVAVLGSQSTGKSTLLNKLFSTCFRIMDSSVRKQTTKGVWLSKSCNADILIMDVEGMDGRERGDDQDFERKSALFALAISDVIIINLWEHQIGLYQGANMGLLKIIFEVNLQLFHKNRSRNEENSLILFVVRDYVGTTPLENLSSILRADLERIWNLLTKPENLENCTIDDFFDLQFTALSHKMLAPDVFEQDILELQKRFFNPSDPNFVFHSKYYKRVPADGFSVYVKGIWEQIITNKDLDLPTQQQLLAQYRCDEISEVVLETIEPMVKSLEKSMNLEKFLDNLDEEMRKIKVFALEIFDKKGSQYYNEIYLRKRSDLINKLHSRMYILYMTQIGALFKLSIAQFKNIMKSGLEKQYKDFNFKDLLDNSRSIIEDEFRSRASKCCIDGTDWSFNKELELLRKEIDKIASVFQKEEISKLITNTEKDFKVQLDEPISLILKNPCDNIWDDVISKYIETTNDFIKVFSQKLSSFNVFQSENEKNQLEFKYKTLYFLKDKIKQEITEDSIFLILRDTFEDKFRFDKNGVPRIWKPSDDINGIYKAVLEDTLKIIPLYSDVKYKDGSYPKLERPKDDDCNQKKFWNIISLIKQQQLSNKFKRVADVIYIDAKRSIVATVTRIPLYFYVLLLALGWNEIVMVIRNPLYFFFIFFLIFTTYILYSLNLINPTEKIIKTMFSQVLGNFNKHLNKHVETPATQSVNSKNKMEAEQIKLNIL